MAPQPGWRVLIATRDDGEVAGPLRIGDYDEVVADADERALRTGRTPRSEWPIEIARARRHPDMTGASDRRIEYLSPEEVVEVQRADADLLRQTQELGEIHAGLRRGPR